MFFFDIEVYPNLFIIVFRNRSTDEILTFTLWNNEGSIRELLQFLYKNKSAYFIGYNSLGYDMQIIQYIVNNPQCTNTDIKRFNDQLIDSDWPIFREKDLAYKTLDVMLVNNYGIRSAKSTSLKMLEFNFRYSKIQDLPYHFNDYIDTSSKVSEIIKYCTYDVAATKDIFDKSIDLIKLRNEFGKLHNLNLINSPEPDLVKKFFIRKLSEALNISEYEVKQLKSYPTSIKGTDIILPHIKINGIPEFISVYNFYNNLVLEADKKSAVTGNQIINLKNAVSKIITHNDTEYVYGSGGLHGCIKPGVYEDNEEYIIEDYDKTSFYPHFAFVHGITPKHFPKEVYMELLHGVFHDRTKYPKKTHFSLNYALKIILNTSFGLSNSEYGSFFDTECTLATTVNGMLTLTMLLDMLYSRIEDITVLQSNTKPLVF